ncbi:transporter substrate-binding domain-containing protein [Aliamphritea spongicola]
MAPQLTRQLFAELGYDVQLIADTNWKRCLLEARLGNIDIVVAAYRIASRESYLAFSEQYIIADEVRIFVNSDADSLLPAWMTCRVKQLASYWGQFW